MIRVTAATDEAGQIAAIQALSEFSRIYDIDDQDEILGRSNQLADDGPGFSIEKFDSSESPLVTGNNFDNPRNTIQVRLVESLRRISNIQSFTSNADIQLSSLNFGKPLPLVSNDLPVSNSGQQFTSPVGVPLPTLGNEPPQSNEGQITQSPVGIPLPTLSDEQIVGNVGQQFSPSIGVPLPILDNNPSITNDARTTIPTVGVPLPGLESDQPNVNNIESALRSEGLTSTLKMLQESNLINQLMDDGEW